MTRSVRVGVDIGGTFTDLVAIDMNGEVLTLKVPSTTGDYSRGIAEGLEGMLSSHGIAHESVSDLLHGTTVATNAVLQRTGARTGLITTEGFRDVLELGRMRRPVLYDLFWEKPRPLVGRGMRVEVRERTGADGTEVVAVEADTVRSAARRLGAAGVESIAVCLLNSYRNGDHERSVAEILAQELPGIPVSLSSDVLAEIDEYERTSTTVINAYLRPVVGSYIASLLDRLDGMNLRCPVLLMQSSGGLMPARAAGELPAYMVESGPAAGVTAGRFVAKEAGIGNAITFDMGGTTAKASVIEDARVSIAHEYEVGGGLSVGTRLQSGGGHVLRVAAIDLAEVGAGGGSIVSVDAGGALKVGPMSSGAVPGPICYGLGGSQVTITDADLVLGYLNPGGLAGGAVKLDLDAARRGLEEQIASRLGLGMYEAAYGIYLVANANMIRAIKAVSTERGRDPRQFTLIAFGGAGPVHAAEMARSLGIADVLVPPMPGLFSAFGLLVADVERRAVRTFGSEVANTSLEHADAILAELERESKLALKMQGYRTSSFERSADVRYVGQYNTLLIELPTSLIGTVDEIKERFEREHTRTYGHAGDAAVEIVNLRVTARAAVPKATMASLRNGHRAAPPSETSRVAYFGRHGLLPTRVVSSRDQLGTEWAPGPVVVEEYDSTIIVPPSARVRCDNAGNVRIDTGARELAREVTAEELGR